MEENPAASRVDFVSLRKREKQARTAAHTRSPPDCNTTQRHENNKKKPEHGMCVYEKREELHEQQQHTPSTVEGQAAAA